MAFVFIAFGLVVYAIETQSWARYIAMGIAIILLLFLIPASILLFYEWIKNNWYKADSIARQRRWERADKRANKK